MLINTSPPLRSALLCLKLQPALITPCSAASTSTPIQRRFSSTAHQTAIPRSSRPINPFQHQSTRLLSTSPSPSAATTSHPDPSTTPSSTTTRPASSSPTTTHPPLTWNAFLSLRRTRRRYNLLSSLTSSLATTGLGVSYILNSSMELEHFAFFGLDPFMVLGIAVLGSGGVGWLLGPFWGNAIFGIRYRRIRGEIAEKEQDLYRRIKKYRVDPSGGSSANPVPDYYGEKIGSVQEYRNWMKDQRAFNKKRQNFFVVVDSVFWNEGGTGSI